MSACLQHSTQAHLGVLGLAAQESCGPSDVGPVQPAVPTWSRRAAGRPLRQALLLLVLCASLSCSKGVLGPKISTVAVGLDPPIYTGKGAADEYPAWSHDGQWIAYHRMLPGSDGPAGVYVIGHLGGRPRLIVTGDLLGPTQLRFSPDDRLLVGTWGLQLVLIDVVTGDIRWPSYTANGAGTPDWSPDGRQILYRRIFLNQGDPIDSAGFHVYEPATGSDRPITVAGQVIWGDNQRWSADGRFIMFMSPAQVATTVMSLQLADSSLVPLNTSPYGILYDGLQWYSRTDVGASGMLFWEHGEFPAHTYFLTADGRSLSQWRFALTTSDVVSNDGRILVLIRPQPTDSVAVLWTRSVDDLSGVTRRQLTYWRP